MNATKLILKCRIGMLGILLCLVLMANGKNNFGRDEVCDKPQIAYSNGNVLLTCGMEGATIHYTTDGSTPTASSPVYNGPITVTTDEIKAVAVKSGVSDSDIALFKRVSSGDEITDMTGFYLLKEDFTPSSEPINTFSGTMDGDFQTISGLDHPLFDVVDGGVVRNVILSEVSISGHEGNTGAIACQIKGGACIYNCGILSGEVGGTGDTGGIVGLLYVVSGQYMQEPRPTCVINCYSFADITSAGEFAAGIVGNNSYGSTTRNYGQPNSALRSGVVNNMFYGDIFGGTKKYPVFGNKIIDNSGDFAINLYDYFLASATFDDAYTDIGQYLRSWPVEEKYLTRFEYYRNILNSNRRLCTWWVTEKKGGEQSDEDLDLIAKWVLDPSIAPYPILKKWDKYPSVINPDPDKVWDDANQCWVNREAANGYQGKELGTLVVTVKAGSNNNSAPDRILYLPILDMDTLHNDYGYAKVQLPYYNEQFGDPTATTHAAKYGNNYTDKVVTGWKVTSVSGGTPGTFVADWESGYNFADRYCTNKDLYEVSGRVFAQGGYYYVPEDVKAITIEAYWGRAFYIRNADNSVDRVNVTNKNAVAGTGFSPAGSMPGTFQGQPVFTNLQAAIRGLDEESSCPTVYDQALVLVGNLQVKNRNEKVGTDLDGKRHPFTIMSADFDFDNEPDFCFQLQMRGDLSRPPIQPIRFDFLSIPDLGLAIRHNHLAYSLGIFVPQGHFEITETACMHTTQFEYDANVGKVEAPVILNGGHFEQIVVRYGSTSNNGESNKTSYFIMGGHFRMKRFTPGSHTNRNNSAKIRLCAVNCIGGEYPEFYLSGIYRPDITPTVNQGNPHCYTNGGKFGSMCGAGYDKIRGDVTFKIDHSIIGEFYGGGINAACPVGGSIDVTIDNSIVGKYCGGPRVGTMAVGKTVTTHATGTIFGQFYGGGNGGTNYYRDQHTDGNSWELPAPTPEGWAQFGFGVFNPLNTIAGLTPRYDSQKGYDALFEFEVFNESNGLQSKPTLRTYFHWVDFGITETGDVTNVLTDCTVLQDFYGGGNLGRVKGNVESTLQGNTVIYGSAYGGGFSAAIPSFRIYDKEHPVFPYRDFTGVLYNGDMALDEMPYKKDASGNDIYYTWTHEIPEGVTGVNTNHPTFQDADGKWYCYTNKEIVDLGVVTGNTILNVNGATKIYGTREVLDGDISQTFYDGAAFGGGNESPVFGNSMVTVDGNDDLLVSNVYGGGNVATTGGSSNVVVYNGTIGVATENNVPYVGSGNVFGGGRGLFEDEKAGSVGVNSTVLIEGGHVLRCVYGGSEYGNVGATATETGLIVPIEDTGISTVTINGGSVGVERSVDSVIAVQYGNVFGGGKGNLDYSFNMRTNINKAFVNINGGRIYGCVFGGGEEGHVLGDVLLNVSNGHIGTYGYTGYDGSVFGGGLGSNTIALTAGSVGGNIEVNVTGGTMLGSVYGGGRCGSVGFYFAPVEDEEHYGVMQEGGDHGYITVNISGGEIGHGMAGPGIPDHIGGNVYGGCKGIVEAPSPTSIAEKMAYAKETTVNIFEANGHSPFIRGSVFGGSEDGHILNYTHVNIMAGQVGGADLDNLTADGNSLHGNVYGGGRGWDQYYDEEGKLRYCLTSGHVYGNTYVTISGGKICRNVYGGGNMSSVGRYEILLDGEGNSILDENGNTQYALADNGDPIPVVGTGLAEINISGGVIGNQNDEGRMHGNVFGSSRGMAGAEFKELGCTHNTDVKINGDAVIIKGSVFGGGEDGHVNQNTKVTVNGGTIGVTEGDPFKGNVYGGGRGIDLDPNGETSPTAGLVKGHTRVYINGGNIINSVYGGGNMSLVGEERVVNINGGLVKVNVFGGSKAIPEGRVQLGMKTVNMRGGHVMGNVYGCNSNSMDGDVDHPLDWTSFVNINGGLIDGSVFGAGYSCKVNGSVCVNIGKDAILKAPNNAYNLYYTDCGGDEPQYNPEGIVPTVAKLVIGNSVYGGSDYYGNNSNTNTWTDFIVSGYSNIYIDGTGYDTQNEGTNTEMTISGGLFGSSTHCESGAGGRHILLKAYGHRDDDGANTELSHATRTLKTIQRCGNLVIDHSNVNFSGMNDISSSGMRLYSVLKVDSTLYMANASGFVLGSPSVPAYMDSIRKVRSVHLKQASYSIYDKPFYPMLDNEGYWEWIGIKGDSESDAHLYYYSDLTGSNNPTALTFSQENVLVFKGDSRLWVRYHRKEKQDDKWVDMGQYYGELEGFFRMRSPLQPWGTESFAYARPKISEGNTDNTCDGGFLSYQTSYNFFTDLGDSFTNTHQHPYTNVLQFFKGDRIDYREWVIREFRGRRWYVDGTRGWGRDDMSKTDGWGLYPDMPKKTVSGAVTYNQSTQTGNYGGVCSEVFTDESLTQYNYDYQNDIIYVVGALSAEDEGALLQGGAVVVEGETQTYPLKLYRYPGGHPLNWSRQYGNESYYDLGDGSLDLTTSNQGLTYPDANGPGANYGAMLIVQDGETIALDNVQMDGLYGHEQGDDTYFLIPGTYYPDPDLEPYPTADPPIDPTTLEIPLFVQEEVSKPMIVTHSGSELTLKGSSMNGTGVTRFGTILERGYNNTNADVWYTNPDYNNPNEDVYHGGGIYVNSTAIVNVENVVRVIGNKQNLQMGSGLAEAIDCNVYLPTFDKHLNIIGDVVLDEGTSIGITSPIRNVASHYVHNTFSPVAVALTQSQALSAWNRNNFHDDLNWFFSNESFELPKYTYYSTNIPDYAYPLTDLSQHINHFDPTRTLFFGWTWNNVVRAAPPEFAFNDIDSPYDLAWLISLVNGSNRQVPSSSLSTVTIEQTEDIDLIQYVWVPIGAQKTGASQFAGTYDGRGHLIDHLDIAYIGEGDRRYERGNYGLFGSLNNGVLDRTFVVSGYIRPVGAANIGGLVGSMEGGSAMITNSEASVDIYSPDKENSENASGGLVGNMLDGEIHSSMAMPILHANLYYAIGGLVGHTIGGGQGDAVRKPKINNSFANVKFDVANNASVTVGGLIGLNYGADMENCYLHLQQDGDVGLNSANFALLAGLNNGGKIKYSYAYDGNNYPFTRVTGSGSDINVSDCYKYRPVMDADNLGYMYYDNTVTISDKNVPMFRLLNNWVKGVNSGEKRYSSWCRPAIAEINGDLPVLLLCNENEGKVGNGDFRSLATYNGGKAQVGAYATSDGQQPGVVIQYAGTIRDENELNSMLERLTNEDYLYIYGDVTEKVTASVSTRKVSIHEDASIMQVGSLGNFDNTYVGISFDNSFANAWSTPGVNYMESQLLPRDWHMFSSPLSNAPLGFDYKGHNINSYNNSDYDPNNHYNNPWTDLSTDFSWLGENTRYWMYGWENSLSQTDPNATFNNDTWQDGYFPSKVGDVFEFGEGCVSGTDEYGRYPYGMDYFTWHEPTTHWINLKRNGPNHWHTDINLATNHHDHLEYLSQVGATPDVNEEVLIVGKGYMMAICDSTFMQSHGNLNRGDKSFTMMKQGGQLNGWNLIGNPYHGYLDYNELYRNNTDVLNSFYVVYDADKFNENAYVYYPVGGSDGGEYSGQYLHPHQGFYVLAELASDVNFNESMIVPRASLREDADGHFRDERTPNYPLVNLYLHSEKGCNDVTVIEFDRPEWGGARKMKELRVGNGQIYAQHDDTHYAALFTKVGTERVPLWFEAKEDDVFTIRWNTANGYFHNLYLFDNITGVRYDMIENESYTFEGHKSDYHSRFYITFSVTDVDENVDDKEQTFAFYDGSQWVITGEGELNFIDLQGRVLARKRVTGGQSRISLPDVSYGMYLLQLTNGQETKIQKIIVNR